jgi:hypothetical protein
MDLVEVDLEVSLVSGPEELVVLEQVFQGPGGGVWAGVLWIEVTADPVGRSRVKLCLH